MKALAAVGVFVEVRAVEFGQAVGVGRKVRRHPVEQYANASAVGAIDETAKARGVTKPGGGGIQAQRLITPGAIERVLTDRQQFEVREAHVLRIRHKLFGQFVPIQPAVVFFGLAPPTGQMHFVNAHRRIERIGRLARGRGQRHRRHYRDNTGRGRAQFRLPRIRVGLLRQQLAAGRQQFEFVARARRNAGQEQFPHAAFAAQAHGVAAAVPEIEVADHAHARGVRCPDRERGASHTFLFAWRGAEDFVRPQMRTFAEQPDVHVAQHGAEAVGVFDQRFTAVMPADAQLVGPFDAGHAFEHTVGVHCPQRPGVRASRDLHGHRARQESANQRRSVGLEVRPQHGENIAVLPFAQGFDRFGGEHRAIQVLATMPHTARAYSRIVRSAEKKPMPATLAMALRAQAWRLWNSASTRACAAR